ncbi:hypothetical protein ACFOMD_01630 [Sphingoaurantiacus capsulatus]|uniref:Uncharacterized protein n=1 Tax=Sphingoaurantiacus capsulatus TaxID=1771310 RepID=A0ABV7X607_9SPHN
MKAPGLRAVIGFTALVGGIGGVALIIAGGVDRNDLAAVAGLVTLLLNQSAQVVRHLFPEKRPEDLPQ